MEEREELVEFDIMKLVVGVVSLSHQVELEEMQQ